MPLIPRYESQETPQTSLNEPEFQPVQKLGTGEGLEAIGKGMTGLGQGILDYQKQTGAVWASEQSASLKLNMLTELENRKSNLDGDGSGFASDYTNYVDKQINNAINLAPNDITKKIITQQVQPLRSQLVAQALNTELQQNQAFKMSKLQEMVPTDEKIVASDPTQFTNIIAAYNAAVMQSGLPVSLQYKLIKDHSSKIALEVSNSMLINNPTMYHSILSNWFGNRIGVDMSTLDDKGHKIVETAQQYGVNPAVALGIAKSENPNLDPNAKNPTSSADGIYQMTDDALTEIGEQRSNNPDDQIRQGVKYIAKQQSEFQKLGGRLPNEGEQRLAYVFGVKGAVNLLKANKNESVLDAIKTYDPRQANSIVIDNNLQNKSVGQVIDQFSKQMKDNIDQHAPANNFKPEDAPWLLNLTEQERFSAYNKSLAAMQQQSDLNKFVFEKQLDNSLARQKNGQEINPSLTPADFNAVYKNPDEAQYRYADYLSQSAYNGGLFKMNSMSPTERQLFVDGKVPKDSSSPSYAIDLNNYEQLQKAKTAIDIAYKNDPANEVLNTTPYAKAAYDIAKSNPTPNSMFNYLSLQKSSQFKQGITQFKPLTSLAENEMINQLKEGKTPQQLVSNLENINNLYGSYAPDVYKQLASNKAFPQDLLAVINMPDEQQKLRVAQLALTDTTKIEQGLPITVKQSIQNDLNSNMLNYKNSFLQNPQNASAISAFNNLAKKDSYINSSLHNNAYSSNIVPTSVQSLLPYNYVSQNGGYNLRLPKQYDKSSVQDGTHNYLNSLKPDSDVKLPDYLINQYYSQGLDKEQINNKTIELIKNKAMFITSTDEAKANLYIFGDDGRPLTITNKEGKPIQIPFEELETSGKSTAFSYNNLKKSFVDMYKNFNNKNMQLQKDGVFSK